MRNGWSDCSSCLEFDEALMVTLWSSGMSGSRSISAYGPWDMSLRSRKLGSVMMRGVRKT